MTRVLFVGITSPMETFLVRLAEGLIGEGFEIGIASTSRDSLPNGAQFLRRHTAERSKAGRLIDLSSSALASSTHPIVVGRIIAHHLRQRRARSLGIALHRDLHLARGHWDVYYLPWNNSAVMQDVVFELGSPVVISCRGSQVNVFPHNPKNLSARKQLAHGFKCAAAVHCVSDHIATAACDLGLDRKKVTVIRPAVDTEFFRPGQSTNSRATGELSLVSVGSLTWLKAQTDTLVALSKLKQRGIRCQLEIIGQGPQRDRISFEAQDLGVAEQVTLIEGAAPQLLLQHLQKADAFILSSLSEGISNAALEAMACGLPVVSTDAGGMREAIEDGSTGLLVPSRSPERLAAAIETLIKDPGLARRLGANGRERVRSEFNIEQQVASFARLFNSVAQRRSHPTPVLRAKELPR